VPYVSAVCPLLSPGTKNAPGIPERLSGSIYSEDISEK
jgi:hypothetical protein